MNFGQSWLVGSHGYEDYNLPLSSVKLRCSRICTLGFWHGKSVVNKLWTGFHRLVAQVKGI